MRTWFAGGMEALLVLLVAFLIAGASGKQLDVEDEATVLTNSVANIKSPDDVQQLADWKEKCRQDVGEDAVKDIEESQEALFPCISKIIKWDKLQHEINRSIPRGELDLVFKKYCGRRDRLMACMEDYFTKLDKCMNDQEREDLKITRKAIDAGIDFVCYNGGDRIALFMAEKGEECLVSQKDKIKECVEERVPELDRAKEDFNTIVLKDLTISEANCKKLNEMHHCVVTYTEKCEDPTPANILDSLITQVLKVTPCWQTSKAQSGVPSGAHMASQPTHMQYLLSHMLTLMAAALTAANILL